MGKSTANNPADPGLEQLTGTQEMSPYQKLALKYDYAIRANGEMTVTIQELRAEIALLKAQQDRERHDNDRLLHDLQGSSIPPARDPPEEPGG